MSTVTIWHNPACGTSRGVLAAIRAAGHEPAVVEYLKTPPTRDSLAAACAAAGLAPAELLRRKSIAAAGLDPDAVLALDAPALLDTLAAHPLLIERPLVFTPDGVRLCRPPERLREILPAAML
ncbi:ArsC/Spx/MgsR family protein [Roseomonas sp. BN140053]|uniref:ArsC/Spx/MgsR family protein n=1 Tax=Roseomonas sp. BN140053 TaxID=3391898 RepID=UPI0039E78593